MFTEVLEHLHYYYVPLVLSKINKALKPGGVLVLTTSNTASRPLALKAASVLDYRLQTTWAKVNTYIKLLQRARVPRDILPCRSRGKQRLSTILFKQGTTRTLQPMGRHPSLER